MVFLPEMVSSPEELSSPVRWVRAPALASYVGRLAGDGGGCRKMSSSPTRVILVKPALGVGGEYGKIPLAYGLMLREYAIC
ncbi:hypothetical protein LIER_42050 [Lithospermum erythrorhizon]|uniref:Uncharacterized protein n=1 Tax=Lithospermum erythrorhizon TaxID=34254 RepID=A0AAV3RMA4_LITER